VHNVKCPVRERLFRKLTTIKASHLIHDVLSDVSRKDGHKVDVVPVSHGFQFAAHLSNVAMVDVKGGHFQRRITQQLLQDEGPCSGQVEERLYQTNYTTQVDDGLYHINHLHVDGIRIPRSDG